jgi:hypothetical protein
MQDHRSVPIMSAASCSRPRSWTRGLAMTQGRSPRRACGRWRTASVRSSGREASACRHHRWRVPPAGHVDFLEQLDGVQVASSQPTFHKADQVGADPDHGRRQACASCPVYQGDDFNLAAQVARVPVCIGRRCCRFVAAGPYQQRRIPDLVFFDDLTAAYRAEMRPGCARLPLPQMDDTNLPTWRPVIGPGPRAGDDGRVDAPPRPLVNDAFASDPRTWWQPSACAAAISRVHG